MGDIIWPRKISRMKIMFLRNISKCTHILPSLNRQCGACPLRSLSTSTIDLSSQDDEGYLHKTRIPTEHFQAGLNRLKIPPLDETCKRYLAAQTPLLSPEELDQTKLIVEDF